jgi:transposase-like protein
MPVARMVSDADLVLSELASLIADEGNPLVDLPRMRARMRNPMPCPHCTSITTRERVTRTQLGYRTFVCQTCRHTFNERTGTPFNHLTVPTDIVLQVVLWRLRV